MKYCKPCLLTFSLLLMVYSSMLLGHSTTLPRPFSIWVEEPDRIIKRVMVRRGLQLSIVDRVNDHKPPIDGEKDPGL
jgi:hypothetical protein